MADDEGKPGEKKGPVFTYPLIRHSDMSEETQNEAADIVTTACEKFGNNNEECAKMIKIEMDKKFGPPFNVVIGEAFGFEISYEIGNVAYLFFGGNGAAKLIKDEMDKKFGTPHHVVVGEAFGFEVSYEIGTILYMFFGGNLAVVVWKC
ncbi:unnamed protein product [Phyllotreta striolata]|uniref:Dynein light chain n=1 Tax=Phyllotreta striolata TaxID=444603 RepID=A0A9N9TVE0_PHYSR|nr:unnamed protein product [Phyllotreta striolata]